MLEGSEGRLVGERIAGEFAEVPIELGTEAEDEDCGEPRNGNRPVVPEELRAVEDAAEEVAAGDDARTQRGDESMCRFWQPAPPAGCQYLSFVSLSFLASFDLVA